MWLLRRLLAFLDSVVLFPTFRFLRYKSTHAIGTSTRGSRNVWYCMLEPGCDQFLQLWPLTQLVCCWWRNALSLCCGPVDFRANVSMHAYAENSGLNLAWFPCRYVFPDLFDDPEPRPPDNADVSRSPLIHPSGTCRLAARLAQTFTSCLPRNRLGTLYPMKVGGSRPRG